MRVETYRFKIGRFECIAVSDGTCEGLGLRFLRAIHPYYYLTESIVCCDIPFKSQV
jgi:hypothetical protein